MASQNLIPAKKQLTETRAIAVLVMLELHMVDFAPQQESQADCSVFSGELMRPTDALDAKWFARIRRDADQFFDL